MNSLNLYKLSVALLLFFLLALPAKAITDDNTPEAANTLLVQQAFTAWQDGRGSVFDLLAEDVIWTVAGSSPVSGTYTTQQEFLEEAVRPIENRLSTAIVPEVKYIIAQGNQVVVIWDGSAQAENGNSYRNSYAWHMVFEAGEITEVTAFLDTWALNQLME